MSEQEGKRRSTQIPIYVCRSIEDQERSRSWCGWIFDAFCGRVRQKWHANRSRMIAASQIRPSVILSAQKGPQNIGPHPLTNSVPSLVKILLVFPKDDQQMDILATTSRRLGWSVSVAKDAEKAVEYFQNRGHELVIVDHRGQRAEEADMICRAIRSSPIYHNSIIIALVKKSLLMHNETDKVIALDLLETGFSRTLMECSHETILINELVGIYTSAILPRTQLAAANTLYVALDNCRDMVHVTNDKHSVQFINKITEKLLGFNAGDVLGKNITDIVMYDNFLLMEQLVSKGHEFEGNLNCKRKNNQVIMIGCKVIPFCISGRKPTHYIYIYNTAYLSESMSSINSTQLTSTYPKNVTVIQQKTSEMKTAANDGTNNMFQFNLLTLCTGKVTVKVI